MNASRALMVVAILGGGFLYQEYTEFKIRKQFKQKSIYLTDSPDMDAVSTEARTEQVLTSSGLSDVQLILEQIWRTDFSWIRPGTSLEELSFSKWSPKKKRNFSGFLENKWNCELPYIQDLAHLKIENLLRAGDQI